MNSRFQRQWLSRWAVILFFLSGLTTVLVNELDINLAFALAPVEPREQPIELQEKKTDFDHESTDLIANYLYRNPSHLYEPVTANGTSNANIAWEQNPTRRWFIDEQRYGEERIIGGLIKNDPEAIKSGFKMFDWGFAHQKDNGSFDGAADAFNGTTFFVQAVARSLLAIEQSPQAKDYASEVAHYKPLVHRAARWMIRRSVWKTGIERNQPYTHRHYIVAAALGLTGKLTGDRRLIEYSRQSISEGLSRQLPDGVNPEKGGYDSSYQMVGIVYAQRWLTYFPDDPLAPRVAASIRKGLEWEETRVLPTGEITTEGNTRTGGQERARNGKIKVVSHRMAIRGFAYWSSVTGEQNWETNARRIAHFYYRIKLPLP